MDHEGRYAAVAQADLRSPDEVIAEIRETRFWLTSFCTNFGKAILM